MNQYVHSLLFADRVYRLFMINVKNTLKQTRSDDINNVQAVMLYNIGEDSMTIGDLMQRKYYLGSNITYNLKKLIEAGYVEQTRSPYDARTKYITSTEKGRALYKLLDEVFQRHVKTVKREGLVVFGERLKEIETNLSTQLMYGD